MSASTALKRVLDSEVGVAEFLPYTHHVTDTIIATAQGDLVTVIRLGGRSNTGQNYGTLKRWVLDLNTLVRGLASEAGDHLTFWSHVVRRRVTEYPEAHYDNAFCAEFDRKYRATFTADSLMLNELYLTLAWRANPDQMLALLSKLEREKPQARRERLATDVQAVENVQRSLLLALSKYDPELLGIYSRDAAGARVPANGRGNAKPPLYVYSEPAEFFGSLVNGEWLPMPVTRGHLAKSIPQNRVFFPRWGETGEIRQASKSRYFSMVEVFDYDDGAEPGHLNTFLAAPFEGVLSQSFSLLSLGAAKAFLKRHKGQLEDAKDASQSEVDQIAYALDRLIAGEYVMGRHHATILVYGSTPGEARATAEKAASRLRDVGLVPKPVSLAIEAAFWAQLPANWKYRPRPAAITSLDFLSFSSLHNYLTGKPTGNPWGPAITLFKTAGDTPLYFNFHYSHADTDAEGNRTSAHTFITGATGEGKTALMGAFMAQCEKFKPTMVVFDKDRGMEIVTRALGGRYFPLAIGEPTGWNPFQLDPNPRNLEFLRGLLVQLSRGGPEPGSPGKYVHEVTQRDEDEINRAIQTVMVDITDKKLRSFTRVLESLSEPNRYGEDAGARPSVRSRLLKWTAGHENGWAFDNPTDALDLSQGRIFGFDYTDFLDHPELRTPIMMYLIHRTEAMKDGRKFVRFFDEFWKPLQDETFSLWAKDGLKTDRKKNAFNVFATQEPGDALESSIAKTIIQQCATQVFLPNPRASKSDYVDGFKLTPAEFDLVYAMPEGSHQFVVKQGANVALAHFGLGPEFKQELAVFAGSPDRSELLQEVMQRVGDDPAVWLPAFMQQVDQLEKAQ